MASTKEHRKKYDEKNVKRKHNNSDLKYSGSKSASSSRNYQVRTHQARNHQVQNHRVHHILTGDLRSAIIQVSLPLMLVNLLQTVYNITDTFWVGKLGGYAIASVTLSYPILFLVTALSIGFGVGGSILIGNVVGKTFDLTRKSYNKELVNELITHIFVVMGFFITLLVSIGLVISPLVANIISKDPIVVKNAILYLRIVFLGIITQIPFFTLQTSLKAFGNTKTIMKLFLTTTLINVILDPILIFGINNTNSIIIPGMGVFGAGLATFISQLSIGLFSLYSLITHKYGFGFSIARLKLNIIKDIIKLSTPTSISMASIAFGSFIATTAAGSLGTIGLSSYGVVTRLFSLLLTPSRSIGPAISIIIAQNYGAGNMKRVYKTLIEGLKIGVFITIIISALTLLFSKNIILFFTHDPTVIPKAIFFLKVFALSAWLTPIRISIINLFNGMKKTHIGMLFTITHNFIIRVAVIYLLVYYLKLGFLGLALTYPTTLIITTTMLVIPTYLLMKKLIKGTRPTGAVKE